MLFYRSTAVLVCSVALHSVALLLSRSHSSFQVTERYLCFSVGPLIFRFCCTQYNIHSGRRRRGVSQQQQKFHNVTQHTIQVLDASRQPPRTDRDEAHQAASRHAARRASGRHAGASQAAEAPPREGWLHRPRGARVGAVTRAERAGGAPTAERGRAARVEQAHESDETWLSVGGHTFTHTYSCQR
jgi:hypothetical protein